MGKASKLHIDLPQLDSSKDHTYFNNIHIQDLDNDTSTINTTSSSSSSSSNALDDSSSFSSSTSSDTADMADDASSPLISCSSSISSQSLYDLSDIMAQLPIKKGLSKYYDGKSQSYSSLSKVTSLEDLMKKCPHGIRKPMKGSKSYGGCLDSFKSHTLPKPTISKRSSRNRLSSSSFPPKRGSLLNNCKPPLAPQLQKSLRC